MGEGARVRPVLIAGVCRTCRAPMMEGEPAALVSVYDENWVEVSRVAHHAACFDACKESPVETPWPRPLLPSLAWPA